MLVHLGLLTHQAVLLELPLCSFLLELEHQSSSPIFGVLSFLFIFSQLLLVNFFLFVLLSILVLVSPVSLVSHVIELHLQLLLRLQEFLDLFLELAVLANFASGVELDSFIHNLELSLEPLDFSLRVVLQTLVRLVDFLNLVLELALDDLDECLLVVLELILVEAAPLLQLLKRDLELFLRLYQVSLVGFLLVFQELALALPKSLVSVVGGLHVR